LSAAFTHFAMFFAAAAAARADEVSDWEQVLLNAGSRVFDLCIKKPVIGSVPATLRVNWRMPNAGAGMTIAAKRSGRVRGEKELA
jgi:hypothetical protein